MNLYGITPAIESHSSLETRVESYLTARGFIVEHKNTYHDAFDPKTVQLLQKINTPAALSIRGRADKVAVHTTRPIVFEYDAKSHVSQTHHNLTLEAMPLAHHVLDSHIGARCLYVITDASGQDRGFWTIKGLPIGKIHIPDRWSAQETADFEKYFKSVFKGVPIHTGTKSYGSGDPFVIIDRKQVEQMSDWRKLIDSLLR